MKYTNVCGISQKEISTVFPCLLLCDFIKSREDYACRHINDLLGSFGVFVLITQYVLP